MTPWLTDRLLSPELLRRVFADAVAQTSTTLLRTSHGVVTLELAGVDELQWDAARHSLALGSNQLTVLSVGLVGKTPAAALLIFGDATAEHVCVGLMRRLSASSEQSEVPEEVLTGVGGGLGQALAGTLNQLMPVEVQAGPCELHRKFSKVALMQSIDPQATRAGRILVARLNCYCAGTRYDWHLLLIPSQELLSALTAADAAFSREVEMPHGTPQPHLAPIEMARTTTTS